VGSKKITTNTLKLPTFNKRITTQRSNRNQQNILPSATTKLLQQVAHDLKTLTNILNKERQPP
jgi:hypothetical protein